MKNIAFLFMALTLSACSFFGGDKEVDLDAPVELQSFDSKLDIKKLWGHNLGKGAGQIDPIAIPAIDGNRLYSADHSGKVTAIDLDTGKRLWQRDLKKTYISGATGASNGLVLIGTGQGKIIALSQDDGATLWTSEVSSEVLAPPVTNGDAVVVLSVDGRVHGLDASDGTERWLVDTNMPLLTVRGNSAPIIVKDMQLPTGARIDVAFVGHDNGKLAAYAVNDGVLLWEARVGVPEGRTDLERMVDIDGRPLYFNGTLYAVSFQGGLMAIQPATGRAAWFQQASSNNGAGGYGGTLAITEADGKVRAFNASAGTELWSSDEYLNRQLNAPAVTRAYVVFADYQGYVHFLSRSSGKTIGRKKVGGDGVRAPTIIHNNQVIVLNNSGGISAFDVSELD